jgi:aminoglycoside 2''-phosphotransferase
MSAAPRQGKVDQARLAARIQTEFPELPFSKAELNDFGEDHAVIVLDGRWVFRFPRGAEAAARGTTERRLLAALAPVSPVAVPHYEHVARDGAFAGYRMIVGRELTEAAFAALPHPRQEAVLAEIGGFLRALHALPPTLLEALPEGARSADADAFVALYAERREQLAAALGERLSRAADRFYATLPAAVASGRRAVVHGDMTEDHVLLDPDAGRLAGVIDFTDAALGDPAYDFAFLWAYGAWAPGLAAQAYGADAADMLARSRWWFTRYLIDQMWWTISGARAYDLDRIRPELGGLFESLGV